MIPKRLEHVNDVIDTAHVCLEVPVVYEHYRILLPTLVCIILGTHPRCAFDTVVDEE